MSIKKQYTILSEVSRCIIMQNQFIFTKYKSIEKTENEDNSCLKKSVSFKLKTCIFVFFFSIIAINTFAQFKETKEFTKRFKVSPETQIQIVNKYGKIELNTWKKDSVVIFFRMEINEKKPDRLGKTLDNLDFDISNSKHYLVIKSRLDNSKSTLENELIKFKETMLQTGSTIKIDLKVWLPENNELRLENKFGDIIMGDYYGDIQITLSNGNLKAGNLPKKSNFNLNFATATLNNLPNGTIVSNYTDIKLRKCGTARIESKSSRIEIDEISELTVDSRRDKFRIKNIDNIDATANFSQFDIDELKTKAYLRQTYGSIDIEKVNSAFSNIYIDSRTADINMNFESESKFNYSFTVSKTELNMVPGFKSEREYIIDSKENKIQYSGYFGKKMRDDQLIINATGGEINLDSLQP